MEELSTPSRSYVYHRLLRQHTDTKELLGL